MATQTYNPALNVAAESRSKNGTNIRQALLSRAELAAEFDVSVRTIARWRAKRRGPPCVRIGRKIFWIRASVLQWLQANEEKSPRGRRR